MKRTSLPLVGLLFVFSVEIFAQSPNANSIALDRVQKDLALLREEKLSRTPAQKKIASGYVTHLRKGRGDPKAKALPAVARGFGPKFLRDDIVRVEVKGEITDELIALIKSSGGSVVAAAPKYQIMTADLPIGALEAIAAREEVRSIMPMAEGIPQKASVSEGDAAHSAPSARSFYGASGAGVKVGVISDSVDYLSQVQASGDLPFVDVLSNVSGSGEGTAMLEIVHDLAPDADLLFATAGNSGPAGMANAISGLTQAGAGIIVDDIFWFGESPFQDDVVAQAAEDAISSGVVYFTSAGNYGNRNDITASVYEGDYFPSPVGLDIYSDVHQYPNGSISNIALTNSTAFLFWSDALGASANDYDLLVYDASGTTLVDSSQNVQDGDDDPLEFVQVFAGEQIVVARYSGEGRFFHLSLPGQSEPALNWATGGFIRGQGGAENVITVAATPATNRTIPFNGTESVETFSSDGYRRVFYDRFGNPYTPGNYSSTGGQVRVKPNVTAADGVETSTPGFAPFFGTSAAAPHAAAMAALMLSARPNLSLGQIIAGMVSGSLDIEAAGFDRDSGVGIIMADLVLNAITSVPGQPTLLTAAPSSGQVELVFNAPSDNGGIPIFGYTGKCGAFSVQGSGSPLIVMGVTNGQSYACSVAAQNNKGLGTYSNVINVVVSVPATPVIVKTDSGDGEIYLTVSVANNGSPEVVSYDANCTDGVDSFTGTSDTVDITVSGLSNGVSYSCTVSATNSVGESNSSPASSPVTPEESTQGLPIWLLYEATKE